MSATLVGRLGFNPHLIAVVERAMENREYKRTMTMALMAHAPSNNRRGTVEHDSQGVNATEVRASARKRVRRNDETPNDLETLRDEGSAARRNPGEYVTMRVPAWLIAAFGTDAAIGIASPTRTVVSPAREESTATPKPRKRTLREQREAARAIARAIVREGTESTYRHDFNAH